ncbi:MAG: hypothetical protein R3A12_11865 [Ignavibacteria bacterium]
MAKILKKNLKPDLMISSTAERAVEFARYWLKNWIIRKKILYEKDVYGGGRVLRYCKGVDDKTIQF